MILYNAVPGGGTDAAQKLASVPIFELRVFAEQKRRHGFLPLTSLSASGTGWATERLPVDRLFRATATFLRLKVFG